MARLSVPDEVWARVAACLWVQDASATGLIPSGLAPTGLTATLLRSCAECPPPPLLDSSSDSGSDSSDLAGSLPLAADEQVPVPWTPPDAASEASSTSDG